MSVSKKKLPPSKGLEQFAAQQTLLLKAQDTDWVKQYRDNRWLNLGDVSEIVTQNPFLKRTREQIEQPHIHLLDLMRQPKNFGFTCSILFNKYGRLAPFQLAILQELWVRPFPMLLGSRGMGKSFILALYAMLRALFEQGRRIVIVGAAFRQAKVVFDYCQELWDDSPVLRDIVGPGKANGPRRDVDRCSLRMGDSIIVALPLGDGTKIRGQRASITIADEFASIPVDIFETVVRGFSAVSMNPVDKMVDEYGKLALKELGIWTEAHEELETGRLGSNQTVVSGTAYYAFNHFYSYWKRYKAIIESCGNPRRLAEIFQGKVPPDFHWKDYSVIRIPYSCLPAGFMDMKQIAQARATVHLGTFQMEYGAVFANDSNGFYKRSLIESCVVGKPDKPIQHASCGTVVFNAVLRGDPRKQYVLSCDPASEKDNFSITALELWPDHRRIVHCWTITRSRFKEKVRSGLTHEDDYYGYAARKIREMMKLFPTVRLAIDSQGGGVAVMEALQDRNRLKEGERPIYPIIDPDNPQPTDDLPGDHLIEVVQFAKSDWVSKANHGMRKDFESKVLLFPEFNPAIIGIALEEDKAAGRVKVDNNDRSVEKLYDTLDDCVMEIEELKDELATIVHTQTGTSLRDRWDTPETKSETGRKGRLRKDRYSALLMANAAARELERTPKESEFKHLGGFAQNMPKSKSEGPMWQGAAWLDNQVDIGLGAIVRRG